MMRFLGGRKKAFSSVDEKKPLPTVSDESAFDLTTIKEETGQVIEETTFTHKYPKKLFIRCLSLLEESRDPESGLDKLAYVNDDFHPQIINNDYFTGQVVFRVRDFDGIVPIDPATGIRKPTLPNTAYFQGRKRAFSLQISGRFKHTWTADDVMFGTFFEKPLILPRGYSLALSLAKRIDSSMVAELNRPDPFMCSPLICAMNLFCVQPLWQSKLSLSAHEENRKPKQEPLELPQWPYGGDKQLSEQVITTLNEKRDEEESSGRDHTRRATVPDIAATHNNEEEVKRKNQEDFSTHLKNATTRRSYFLKEEHRKHFVYHPDTLYSFDFFSPYVDLNRMQLKLGISIDVLGYLNGNPLRYQCRSRDGKVTFFTIEVGVVD